MGSLDMEGRRSRAGERKEESRVEEREGGMKVRLPDRPPLLRTKSLVLMEEAAGGKGEMFFKEKCSNKGELLKHLSKTGFLEPENPAFFHGRIYSRCPPAPVVAWHSSDNPRWDHQAPEWLTATEYQDTEQAQELALAQGWVKQQEEVGAKQVVN